MIFRAINRVFEIGERPLLMGVLNITPDSFYDGGRYEQPDKAESQAEKLLEDGVDIIDIGGESTRPGAKPVDATDEIRRVVPIIEKLSKKYDAAISIDTYKTETARAAIKSGAVIINDISALTSGGDKMARLAADSKAGVVLMHMRGDPETMQQKVSYSDVVGEVYDFLEERIKFAESIGIDPQNIAVDPGIGFGKKQEHNLEILRQLGRFCGLKTPILVGLSRKSFIGEILRATGPEERLFGSLAANIFAYMQGARILRIHDVKETREFFETYLALIKRQ